VKENMWQEISAIPRKRLYCLSKTYFRDERPVKKFMMHTSILYFEIV
jgi:hypothetical protein